MEQTNKYTGFQHTMEQEQGRQSQKMTDRPDEIIVNEQEQNEPVNPQDPEEEKINENDSDAKERAYREGSKDDSETGRANQKGK